MAHVLLVYRAQLATDGRRYTVQACGRERDDATWEAWLEFAPDDGSEVVRSARETTQPNMTDLEYWATGLTPVYLDGALQRALRPPVIAEPPSATATYDGPAPAAASDDDDVAAEAPEPVLNPFSVYVKGEDLLRRQLGALSPRHLRAIILAYELAPGPNVHLQGLKRPELVALIVVAVRSRLAA